MYVLEPTQDVNGAIRKDDPRFGGVLDRRFGLAVFARDTSDRSAQMIAGETLDVSNLKGLYVAVEVSG